MCILLMLLRTGARKHARNFKGETAMHRASAAGCVANLRALLEQDKILLLQLNAASHVQYTLLHIMDTLATFHVGALN